MDFEWDALKEVLNLQKHGVTFSEAIETFFDPSGFQMKDRKHSQMERRYYWIGKNRAGRVLTTRFSKRGNVIRIIGSAEWRKFRRLNYETTQKQ